MDSQLTILHLRASNFVGGPEKQILELCRRLPVDRYRSVICTFPAHGPGNTLLEAAQSIPVESICLCSEGLGSVRQLRQILREQNVDILCSHGYKPNIIGSLAVIGHRVKHIAVSRGWTGESFKIRCYEWLDRKFLNVADHVVAVSEGQRQKVIISGVSAKKVSVIHNGISLDNLRRLENRQLRSELGIPTEAVVVASAGRLSPEKNYSAMISAAALALEKIPHLYFVIFGEGFLRKQLERQIADLRLGSHFMLPGFSSDLFELLSQIDIFMLPSFTEGLPNVILEALAFSKPVIATAVGGTPEILEHGVTGFLVEPGEVERMADYIVTVAQTPDLGSAIGQAGHDFIQKHFTFEGQTRKYEELYEAVAESQAK